MNVLITGARGFIGRNLVSRLQDRQDCSLSLFDLDNSREELRAMLAGADLIYHLAGVNRPQAIEEFETGNAGLTREVCSLLVELGRAPAIIMSSSVQAALENPYGLSKRRAEDALREFTVRTGARTRIYRLKNVFGKWCRPNYNSVVATFCHGIANDQHIHISDPSREIELVYVDDVVDALLSELPAHSTPNGYRNIPSFRLSLGDLVGRIQALHEMAATLRMPDFAVPFNRQLYTTYLSYVPQGALRRRLQARCDDRGALAEILKSSAFGQLFVSRTRPGVTRGNHYHHTKTEKFYVLEGDGIVRMRQIESSEIVEHRVRGGDFEVIDIPPGYTHSLENAGSGELVTLFWSSEVFDPDRLDTYFLPVCPPVVKPSSQDI